MLYHLFQYLDRSYDLPGAGMFQYISFRSALAVILALLITITFGQGIIRFMQRRQIGEEIRNLGWFPCCCSAGWTTSTSS